MMTDSSEAANGTHSQRLDAAVRDRLDDIAGILDDAGHGSRSRADLTRALVFACPLDDPEHVTLIVRVGAMRALNEIGWDNGDWLAEGESDLGWYAESVDRSEIVAELRRVRRELGRMKWHLDDARKTLAELLEEEGVEDAD